VSLKNNYAAIGTFTRLHIMVAVAISLWGKTLPPKNKACPKTGFISPPSPCVTNPGTFQAISGTCRIAFAFHGIEGRPTTTPLGFLLATSPQLKDLHVITNRSGKSGFESQFQ